MLHTHIQGMGIQLKCRVLGWLEVPGPGLDSQLLPPAPPPKRLHEKGDTR
jgi:hypothetical protein